MGRNKIYEFMDTWDYDEDWLYCVDFLTQQSDDCSDYYKYEVGARLGLRHLHHSHHSRSRLDPLDRIFRRDGVFLLRCIQFHKLQQASILL